MDQLDQTFYTASVMSPDFWIEAFPPAGIFGLAFGEISISNEPTPAENLNKSGQLPEPIFSFRLSDIPGLSELVVGGANYTAFKNDTRVCAPVTKKGFWQISLGGLRRSDHQVLGSINYPAIVDTGTTLIIVPTAMANDYFSGISGAQCTTGTCTGMSRLFPHIITSPDTS